MNHLHEDVLDEYALGRISDKGQLDTIEDHLMVCEECRQAVEALDAIRLALARTLVTAKN